VTGAGWHPWTLLLLPLLLLPLLLLLLGGGDSGRSGLVLRLGLCIGDLLRTGRQLLPSGARRRLLRGQLGLRCRHLLLLGLCTVGAADHLSKLQGVEMAPARLSHHIA
jgi:hypothetical protein